MLFILVKKNIDDGRIDPDLVAQFLTGIFIQLSQQKFNDTKDLTKYFPTVLLEETETVIGQPDARDWGGLYVKYNFNGVRKFWLLDQKKVIFRQNIITSMIR
jgi:hypothetical protein